MPTYEDFDTMASELDKLNDEVITSSDDYDENISDIVSDIELDNRRIELNTFQFFKNSTMVSLLLQSFIVILFLVIPLIGVMTGKMSYPTFAVVFGFVFVGFLFYCAYKLNLYNIRKIIHHEIRDLENEETYLEEQLAQYVNENCECPEDDVEPMDYFE